MLLQESQPVDIFKLHRTEGGKTENVLVFPLDEAATKLALEGIAKDSEAALREAKERWLRENQRLHETVFGLSAPRDLLTALPYREGALYTYGLVGRVSDTLDLPLPHLDYNATQVFINPYMEGLAGKRPLLDINSVYEGIGKYDQAFGEAIGTIGAFNSNQANFRRGVVATYLPLVAGRVKRN
jgi:hypothetical protein